MKSLLGAVLLALLALAGVGVWLLRSHESPPPPPPLPNLGPSLSEAVKQAQDEAAKTGMSSSLVIGPDGKRTTVSFGMPGAENVRTDISVSDADGQVSSTMIVTLLRDEPVLLTPAAYERIQAGMA